jgi:hypothetical protein
MLMSPFPASRARFAVFEKNEVSKEGERFLHDIIALAPTARKLQLFK